MGIYQIRNKVNGKVYIGQSINLEQRKKHHFSLLCHNKHYSYHLQRAFNQYGESNFIFSILEEVKDPLWLTVREQYWLDLKKASDPNYGYNIASCAEAFFKGKHHTEISKEKSRLSNLGKVAWNKGLKTGPLSEEHKQKIRIANKGKSGTKGMKGKHHTTESKYKQSLAMIGKKKGPLSEEHKQKISDHSYWKGKPSPFLGKHHTEESVRKIVLAKTGMHYTKKIK
jgi:group I intron endonuclease